MRAKFIYEQRMEDILKPKSNIEIAQSFSKNSGILEFIKYLNDIGLEFKMKPLVPGIIYFEFLEYPILIFYYEHKNKWNFAVDSKEISWRKVIEKLNEYLKKTKNFERF